MSVRPQRAAPGCADTPSRRAASLTPVLRKDRSHVGGDGRENRESDGEHEGHAERHDPNLKARKGCRRIPSRAGSKEGRTMMTSSETLSRLLWPHLFEDLQDRGLGRTLVFGLQRQEGLLGAIGVRLPLDLGRFLAARTAQFAVLHRAALCRERRREREK